MFGNTNKEKGNDENRNNRKDENVSNVVNTSERRILFYKTKICPWYIKGKCERKKTCLYAHAQNELRELPNLCKTSLCPKLKINELCHDKKCKYAHTNIELRATENLYKTALCESFLKGKCFAGQFCRYAHGTNELRENPMEITDRNIIIGTSKVKNEKMELEKKKNNNMHFRRNETFCVFPKKEYYSAKYRYINEEESMCDVAETVDTQNLNESINENTFENKKKESMYNGKNMVKNYMTQEENVKFNDDQFLNDSLNVLGFLEETNNVENTRYNNSTNLVDYEDSNYFNKIDFNMTDLSINRKSSSVHFNGNDSWFKRNVMKESEDFMLNSSGTGDNNKIGYHDFLLNDDSFSVNDVNINRMHMNGLVDFTHVTDIDIDSTLNGMDNINLNSDDINQFPFNYINNINNIDNINNMKKKEKEKEKENKIQDKEEDQDGWNNFPLYNKTKNLIPENDYFKIFNYGIYNNIDKKLYENCEVYKNQMSHVDKSLFIQ